MAQLVIDIGNTRTKIALFEGSSLHSVETKEQLTAADLSRFLHQNSVESSIVSSVDDEIGELEEVLNKSTNYIRFSSRFNELIRNEYKSKATLGLDRLAGIIGARSLFPKTSCLVIDAGTCITYDAVDAEGIYLGGSISPGLNMRLKAMHSFTGRLPLIELKDYDNWYGHDTASSMLSGVVNGTMGEVNAFIETYHSKYTGLQVLLCGGDANFFDTRLKNSIFAHTLKTEPDLVLIGLNEVIRYNDQNI